MSSNKILDNLLQRPRRPKRNEAPRFQVFGANYAQQADILYMPNDGGFKFILCVIDDGSHKVDAEPLKARDSATVAKAFANIYKRGILKLPKRIEVDSGSEFKGRTLDYMRNNNVVVRVAIVGRKSQQAYVERLNQEIQKHLFKKMTAVSLLTGQENREWVDNLEGVIKAINAKAKMTKPPTDMTPLGKGKLLKLGTKVRVALEEPLDVEGRKLHGKFRTGDVRWNTTVRTIKKISLKPGFPPLYLLDDPKDPNKIQMVGYTRNALQVIPENEEYPLARDVLKKGKVYDTYVIEKFIGNKMVGKKMFLKVKWLGFPANQASWESVDSLMKQQPQMTKEYLSKL